MRNIPLWPIFLLCLYGPFLEAKTLNVVTTTPDLTWLAGELLKDDGKVTTLLKGQEDAHVVDAVPSYILAAARADVFCFVGMSLEIGWVPKVIEKTANGKIQPGRDGYCDVGKVIDGLEKPGGAIDRSMGDVHPEGNPHYYMGLPQLKKAAGAMAAGFMLQLDPAGRKRLEGNLSRLQGSIDRAYHRLKARLSQHFGPKLPVLAQYHGNFTYFARSYGFPLFGNVEETPGVAPSAGAVARRAIEAGKGGVSVVLAVPYNPRSVVEKFAGIAGIPVIIHSDMAQPDRDALKNPLLVQQSLVEKIIETLPGKARASAP